MASGLARGAKARGKRIAFGDGTEIKWDHYSEIIFGKKDTATENPNIARPGEEGRSNLEWIPFYRGNRLYNRQSGRNWIWNYDFKAIPGELFFSDDEHKFAERLGKGYVIIEPNVPEHKSVATNKRWPALRYDKVARYLKKSGVDVRQFAHGAHRIPWATPIKSPSFRHAARVLQNASLYIGPEGGLHHAAAAVGIPAVVIFGGFIPPSVTGYDIHTNLTGGAVACGSLGNCSHCARAMDAIDVQQVYDAAVYYLKDAA